MDKKEFWQKTKVALKKTWFFIWEEDSLWSWIVNIVLAIIIVKFLVYPGLGLMLGTQFPIVAVVSNSMEHKLSDGQVCGKNVINYKPDFDNYWKVCGDWYEQRNLTKDKFSDWSLKNGFNKGDIMILKGKKPDKINIGDVIVFRAKRPDIKPEPIIHRVVAKTYINGTYYFTTKGDWNSDTINDNVISEKNISQDRILGNAFIRVPLLGYLKIVFVEFIGLFKAG